MSLLWTSVISQMLLLSLLALTSGPISWPPPHLNRSPAELPAHRPWWVVDKQRFAVSEAATARIYPAAERCDCGLCCSDVVLFAVLVGLVPAALVLVVMQVLVGSVAAALPGTHAGHSAQRAGQLPPCTTTGRLHSKCCCCAIIAPCRMDTRTDVRVHICTVFEASLQWEWRTKSKIDHMPIEWMN